MNPPVAELCHRLHSLFASLRRHRFNAGGLTDTHRIPENGIYILYEQRENAHGTDRIVRIGTHTGQSNLRKRLVEHFITPNKDRSIFRKNIGRAILNKNNAPFLEQWNWDMTSRKNKKRYGHKLDRDMLASTEAETSKTIRSRFSFAVFQVDEKDVRMALESRIIATVAQCHECGPSRHWFGLHSPVKSIQNSGLWQVQGLNAEPMSPAEMKTLESLLTP
jgi:hypothetical protein